uniref:ATP synthase complex subunit 8 n=1 Tax=Harpovoluta charcoti TaxID=2783712 RepID=A0A872PLS0_9CAEN|nr:ATP synthase F0 subunit 8 [Harpovoluta charcoti]
MPQLSPLNWIFLFFLFWAAVLSFSILIWWSVKILFQSGDKSMATFKKNKWNW